jgi:hypothetical protein
MVDSYASKLSLLPDPYDDRAAKTLAPPPNKSLENAHLYPYSGKSEQLSIPLSQNHFNLESGIQIEMEDSKSDYLEAT